MKKIIVPIVLVFLSLACSDTKEIKATTSDTPIDTTLYISMGDPDTALVMSMFTECTHYNYWTQREQYMRWDTERATIHPLFKAMFGSHDAYQERLKLIESNQMRFIDDVHNEMTTSARQYGGVSGTPEFTYLVSKKDTAFKALIEEMLEDENVSEEEKEILKDVLGSM
ncbi:hypothetical protein [Chitinophaga agri]|uniref:Uncharacterized protein n=1 Tax=Chitinophaga agri TaxID=2703787 RepID=A0A6B9ZBA7_9BACT|nr:hypothetical protein [Chitinophaga agri]QHS58594.1 hypothetical protein GWR21_02975 [Chitinophaga agri]